MCVCVFAVRSCSCLKLANERVCRGMSGGEGAEGDQPPQREAHAVPHRGFVVLETCAFSGAQRLIHDGTQEHVAMPADAQGRCELNFLASGDAFIYDEASTEWHVDDLLRCDLYEDNNGNTALLDNTSGEDVLQWLSVAPKEHLANVSLFVGPTAAKLSIPMAIFERPVDGAQCFWSVPGLHALGGFSTKPVSMWLNKGIVAWENLSAQMGVPKQTLRSKCYSGQGRAIDRTRSLPWASFGTSVLVVILLKFSCSSPQVGGFKAQSDKSASEAVLRSFLAIVSAETFGIDIFVATVRSFGRWPRQPDGSGPLRVPCHRGCVDVRGLRLALERLGRPVPFGGDEVPLVDFVLAIGHSEKTIPSAYLQLGLQIGGVLDLVVARALDDGPEQVAEGRNFEVQLMNLVEFGHGRTADERALLQYWHIGRAASSDAQELSLAVDKSRVFGLGVFSGVVCKPDNTCCWLVPQVGL